ncbi:MAG: TSUP family transporter [Bacteroidetes bacterium]|jgi:uncharacterized membrane protein YfcA|nr:TSUP family transporter [Bacteroidota bacterium]
MATEQLILLLATGLLAGIVAGFFGVGGGIVIIPALVFIFGMTQHQAQGTSLGVLLFPIGAMAVWNYHKAGFINFKYVFILVAAFVLGGYFGSLISVNLPNQLLKRMFGILMILVGIKMFFGK